MPRSVIVLSADPHLFDNVPALLGADPRFLDLGDELHCDGPAAPLTNIYPVKTDPVEWNDWELTDGAPDPRTSSLLIFESRSPDWVAEVGKVLAHGLASPVWFVDSADHVWPAGQVDPARVALA